MKNFDEIKKNLDENIEEILFQLIESMILNSLKSKHPYLKVNTDAILNEYRKVYSTSDIYICKKHLILIKKSLDENGYDSIIDKNGKNLIIRFDTNMSFEKIKKTDKCLDIIALFIVLGLFVLLICFILTVFIKFQGV